MGSGVLMNLTLWRHPKTGEPRFYLRGKGVKKTYLANVTLKIVSPEPVTDMLILHASVAVEAYFREYYGFFNQTASENDPEYGEKWFSDKMNNIRTIFWENNPLENKK